MAFTMACPNFKKGLKMAFGPLEVMVRAPIPLVYADFYIVHDIDTGELQILYSQDICW
jgi:hypothetical protein